MMTEAEIRALIAKVQGADKNKPGKVKRLTMEQWELIRPIIPNKIYWLMVKEGLISEDIT